jgi:hypothetical protein
MTRGRDKGTGVLSSTVTGRTVPSVPGDKGTGVLSSSVTERTVPGVP